MVNTRFFKRLSAPVLAALMALSFVAAPAFAAPPVKGAVFTTDYACHIVNANTQYEMKEDVFLNGGPAKPGAAGLPNGDYYVKVTEPNGRLLGTSVGSANARPIHVSNGEFSQCSNLYNMVIRASDGSIGYDDTSNSGGEYKVWVSNESSFANNSSKTDNFKVTPGVVIGPQ